MRGIAIALASVAFAVSTIPCAAQDAPYRLRDDDALESHVDKAIDVVNAVLQDPGHVLFRYKAASKTPVASDIPVYIVESRDAQGTIIRVPENCRCVVIGSNEFNKNFARIAGEGPLIADHQSEMLTFLLLHELGHITQGDYGQFLPNYQSPALNLDANETKRREDAADLFAAEVLREQVVQFYDPEFDDYVMEAVWSTAFLQALSFVISSRAAIDCFGCRPLGLPTIFWDHGRSHPNFEYRLLRINHMISPTELTQEMLAEFERHRQDTTPKILYEQK